MHMYVYIYIYMCVTKMFLKALHAPHTHNVGTIGGYQGQLYHSCDGRRKKTCGTDRRGSHGVDVARNPRTPADVGRKKIESTMPCPKSQAGYRFRVRFPFLRLSHGSCGLGSWDNSWTSRNKAILATPQNCGFCVCLVLDTPPKMNEYRAFLFVVLQNFHLLKPQERTKIRPVVIQTIQNNKRKKTLKKIKNE